MHQDPRPAAGIPPRAGGYVDSMRGSAASVAHWASGEPGEDSWLLDAARGAGAVLDGLAGHGNGDLASATARAFLQDAIRKVPDGPGWPSGALEHARAGLQAARAASPNPQMTCAAVAGRIWPDRAEAAWCGDCRAYRRHPDGRLTAETYDHDFVYEQEMAGRIGRYRAQHIRAALARVQTQSEAFHLAGPVAKKAFRRSHLMCSDLSSGPIGAVILEGWGPDDTLVLTSDGIHDNLTAPQMQDVAAGCADPGQLAADLVAAAQAVARAGEGRGHPDDITCVTLAL